VADTCAGPAGSAAQVFQPDLPPRVAEAVEAALAGQADAPFSVPDTERIA
jgi:hypothetical protein